MDDVKRFINQKISWRVKLMFCFWCSYAYNSTRRSQLKHCLASENYRSSANSISDSDTRDLKRTTQTLTGAGDERSLARIGVLPRLYPIGTLYQIVSTTFTFLMFLNSIWLLVVDSSARYTVTRYMQCYAPRVAAPYVTNERFMTTFVLVVLFDQIFWRTFMVFVEKEFDFKLIPFLFADQTTLSQRIKSRAAELNRKSHMDLLDRSLFYRVGYKYSAHIKFRLRPNRSLAAKSEMIKWIDSALNQVLLSYVPFASWFVVMCLYISWSLQHTIYPSCSMPIDDAQSHLVRFFAIIGASTLFWLDQSYSLYFVTAFGYILAHDLMIYWRVVRSRIDSLHRMMCHQRNYSTDQHRLGEDYLSTLKFEQFSRMSQYFSTEASRKSSSNSNVIQEPQQVHKFTSKHNLDLETLEVQSLLIDFFAQLDHVDQFISVLIFMVLGVWLSCNAAVTLANLQFSASTNSEILFIRVIQFLGLLAVTMLSWLVLSMKRNTEAAYLTLCSIIAMDGVMQKKMWLLLLQIYTTRPRYSFTLFHGPIFTQTTFIKVISYTLSLVIIINTPYWSSRL